MGWGRCFEGEAADARIAAVRTLLHELIDRTLSPGVLVDHTVDPVEEREVWYDRDVGGFLRMWGDLLEDLAEKEGPIGGMEMHTLAATILDGTAHDVGDLDIWRLMAALVGRPAPEAMPPEMDMQEYFDRFTNPRATELAEEMGMPYDGDHVREEWFGPDAPPPVEDDDTRKE